MGRNSYTTAAARRLGYRSGFESDLAADLQEHGIDFEYESKNCKLTYYKTVPKGAVIDKEGVLKELDKGDKVIQICEYTCDFLIPKKKGGFLWLETKGRFVGKDRTKHKLIKAQHPDIDLRMLFSYNGKATPKLSYLQWCREVGIPAATVVKPTKTRKGRYLPTAWMKEIA